jgi:hypothetical protein
MSYLAALNCFGNNNLCLVRTCVGIGFSQAVEPMKQSNELIRYPQEVPCFWLHLERKQLAAS